MPTIRRFLEQCLYRAGSYFSKYNKFSVPVGTTFSRLCIIAGAVTPQPYAARSVTLNSV